MFIIVLHSGNKYKTLIRPHTKFSPTPCKVNSVICNNNINVTQRYIIVLKKLGTNKGNI